MMIGRLGGLGALVTFAAGLVGTLNILNLYLTPEAPLAGTTAALTMTVAAGAVALAGAAMYWGDAPRWRWIALALALTTLLAALVHGTHWLILAMALACLGVLLNALAAPFRRRA
ncbi:hypothetical protein [Roseivivax sp. CAU 1761]